MSGARGGGPARVGVVGAGILGLAVARAIQLRRPDASVVVLEKEGEVAQHQSGRNSGVVHAGLYYVPGSLKARFCVEGVRDLRRYCEEKGLPYEECGKLVVALEEEEIPRLRALHERATANGVEDLRLVDAGGLRELEPHATGLLALHSPHTAIVDFAAVTRALAGDVRAAGGEIRLGAAVTRIRQTSERVSLLTASRETVILDRLVNCAGLQADRVAGLAGDEPAPRIIPFRGEYLRLVPERRDLVRGLIYPVPDPRYPFLGVHLTPTVDGDVLVGPNAVLAFAREGYAWATVKPGDVVESLRWPGFRRLAGEHWRTGLDEMRRSRSRRRFVAAASRYVPALTLEDVVPGPAGVRAQAVDTDGSLVDDFRVTRSRRVVNVRNAPSPGATSALAFAGHVADEVLGW